MCKPLMDDEQRENLTRDCNINKSKYDKNKQTTRTVRYEADKNNL